MNGQKILRILAAAALGAAVLWLAVAWCLPVLLPFLIGLVVARLAQPLADRLRRTLHLPRRAATFVCVSGVFALLSVGAWLLVRTLLSQLGALARALPELLASLADPLARVEQRLLQLCARLPGNLGPAARSWVENTLRWGTMLGEQVSALVLNLMGSMVAALPDVVLFTVTSVLSSFMLCARLPELRRRVRAKLPPHLRVQLRRWLRQMKAVLSGWLRGQLRLMGVTFAIVTAGLLLLRQSYALVLGVSIALIDALPVLGSGTVLLPWAAAVLLQGNTQRALSLVTIYAAAALTRTALEPRVLGKPLGLPPLLTLIALYAGFRLCGVAGMLLFPIGAVLLRQGYGLIDAAVHPRTQGG